MSELKVLIAIDEPNLARFIVETATNLLDKKKAEITLLNVSEDLINEEEYFYRAPEKFIQHEAQKADFAYIENYLETEGFSYKGFVYKDGPVVETIMDMADREKYDLLVVGSHNKHAFQRAFLGSVSYKVSRQSKCSVLVIKPTQLSELNKDNEYQALFTTDTSEYSEYASNSIGKFLDKKRAVISVLNVTLPVQEVIPVDAYIYTDIARIMKEADEIAAEVVKSSAINIAKQGFTLGKKYHINGDPASVIIDEAEKDNMKLIVMGSHGQSGIEDWIIGSVSSRVYEYSPISVLIIKK